MKETLHTTSRIFNKMFLKYNIVTGSVDAEFMRGRESIS